MPEEVDLDAVGRVRVLVEREDDHVARGQQVEDSVERAPLADDAEARLVEAPRDERIEPGWLDRAADEMEPAAEVRIVGEAGDRRHFPVAEMTGEHEHAFALLQCRAERLDVL